MMMMMINDDDEDEDEDEDDDGLLACLPHYLLLLLSIQWTQVFAWINYLGFLATVTVKYWSLLL